MAERIEKKVSKDDQQKKCDSNDKLVFDDRTAHSLRCNIIAEDALQESVNFTKQIHASLWSISRRVYST